MADQTRHDEDASNSARIPCHTVRGTSDEYQDPPPSSKKRSFEECDAGDELALLEPRAKNPRAESPRRSDTTTTTTSDEARESDRPTKNDPMRSEKLPMSPGARTNIQADPHEVAEDARPAAVGLQQGTTPESLASTEGNAEQPLSSADIAKFEEDGFIMLRGAFDAEVASECRDHIWRRLQAEGVMKDNPSTWVYKNPIAEIYGLPSSPKKRRGLPWAAALSPRLKAATSQLVGAGAWEAFGCGWWMVTFPGFAQPPWGPEGTWHVDGAHFRHYPHSREIGLLPIFLFSDVRPGGGGTAVLRGSHKRVAEILWKRAGTTGMRGPRLSSVAREILLPAADEDIIETTGSAGDVMLTHPLLLHSRSTNLAPVGPSGVRFMCHPAVPLKQHLDFRAAPGTFSPVQRAIWRSWPGHVRGGSDVASIPTPDECDHSAIVLHPAGNWTSGKGRKKKSGKRAQTKNVPHSVIVTDDIRTRKEADDDLQKGADSQSGKDGQLPAEAAQPDVNNAPQDVQLERSDGSVKDEQGPSDTPLGEEDAALLATMGFSGFGACSSRW